MATAATAATATASQPVAAANAASDFASQWTKTPDRVWIGAEYWANPLQDWRVANGRIECVNAAPNRNVHLLTRQLGEQQGNLAMSVQVGRRGGGPLGGGKGSAGFRIGIMGPLREYRNSLIFGQGIDAGFNAAGELFIGNQSRRAAVDLSAESIELRLAVEPSGEQCIISLSAHTSDGKELARVVSDKIPSTNLAGNIALVANFGAAGGTGAAKGAAKAGKKAKNKASDPAPDTAAGEFWFSDWKVAGSRLEVHDDRAFGPILFNHYTLSAGILKMTAQMPPLGPQDSQTVGMMVGPGSSLSSTTAQIDPESRTATFRWQNWSGQRDVPYRLTYTLKHTDGTATPYEWTGTIRRDPVDQPVLTVADVSCNIHEAFPNAGYTANMAKLNPDLIAFVGDQFYESTGGYGVQRAPLEPAILDYLRKWYMHGWTWRELTRDRPSISIPDDHDVYQGNNWGEGGAPQTGTQEEGGYNMPAPWVNVVHRTQTSHHPDPWDATPGKQGISVYSGPLVYGRVSFAILADRQFKSGPQGKVPPTGGRGDHVTDPNFDPKTADVPGLQLLGPSQMKHLKEWVTDWRGADMKAVISQTIFTAMATTHGGPGQRLVADYDTNGWPQTERNAALREIRKAFAVHIAGDQHLPAVVHYGIEEHRDAGIAFAGPAVNTGYPRWFEPLKPGENRAPAAVARPATDGRADTPAVPAEAARRRSDGRDAAAPEITGDFRDSFGHPLTVLAVVNGAKQPAASVLQKLHDKASGLGLVRFDKKNRRITIECWPFLADPTQPGTQFPGWPVTFDMLANYGRRTAAHLPRLEMTLTRSLSEGPTLARSASEGTPLPILEVIDETNGELVYGLRLPALTWQPHVYAPGKYTVRISIPEDGRSKEFKGLEAKAGNEATVEVTV